MTEGAVRMLFFLIGAATPPVLYCFIRGLSAWIDDRMK